MKPTVLLILDGWGVRDQTEHNGIKLAQLPNYQRFLEDYPWTTLLTHGEAVGLLPGVMGNSEVGHTNIGAGRIVHQLLTRITHAIEDGSFYKNEVLLNAMHTCKEQGKALHLMGLMSDAGVHSDHAHIEALINLAKQTGLKKVFVHAFMDGRDSNPKSGAGFLQHIERHMENIGVGQMATLMGRYYAMDRDQRWERIKRAYDAMVHGIGDHSSDDPAIVMQTWYDTVNPHPGFGDEFIAPIVFVADHSTEPIGKVQAGDVVIHCNFRPDRARQITRAFTDNNFTEFDRGAAPSLAQFVCMAPFSDEFQLPVAFSKEPIHKILPELISEQNIKQFRCAETEKYAHVTYFFNGGQEKPFPGEERKMIPSNREVETYDLAPEMRAREVTTEVRAALKQHKYGLFVVNFANPDMVGHTAKEPAVIKAVETLDDCMRQIAELVLEQEGHFIITADHGNCEELIDKDGLPHTQHTLNPVPLILIGNNVSDIKLREGRLCDIAPTLLQLMNIEQPKEMTGKSLIGD